jgi:hypothetical protein
MAQPAPFHAFSISRHCVRAGRHRAAICEDALSFRRRNAMTVTMSTRCVTMPHSKRAERP